MTISLHRSVRAVLSIFAIGIILFQVVPQAATYTLAPLAYQTVLDTNGNPVSGAKICTYLAGTTTQTATFSDSIGTPNANPIRADSSGRFVAYLAPGASYKFVIQDATGTVGTCDGVTIRTQDNISAVPASSSNLDITGTAGEALTAGQAVYLSDGSGGKTAGQWYKADSANTYSSSAAVSIGMAPASILAAGAGTIRLAGSMTGLAGLTLGTTYYAGSAGALTSTQPTNGRVMGIADSTSTLVLAANPGTPNLTNGAQCFRLTLTTGTPVTTADVTGASATTIFASPYGCSRISLYDALGNATTYTSAQFSIAVPATTSQMYDVFAFSNAGVPTLEVLAWTNDSTRATAIVLTTTGSYTKSGDLTRRYLGSFRTTTVSGQTEDSLAKRLVWNYYNRVRRPMRVLEATASWNYTTATLRQANAAAANQLAFVVGVAEVSVEAQVQASFVNSTGAATAAVSIGADGVASVLTGTLVSPASSNTTGQIIPVFAAVRHQPAAGYHFDVWMEYSSAAGTTSWQGVSSPFLQSGITGSIDG